MKTLKQRLRDRDVTIGSWITIGHPAVAEIMAQAGFDWLTVDMEHSAITLSEAQQLIQVIELSGCTPLVRVSANDPVLIKRVMDAGAHGVIVPMVNSAAEAKQAVAAVKYPPMGTRGVGLARAQGYGLGFEKYKQWVNKESVVIVQIEHIQAVNNLEQILAVEGVDGFIIGPYDLSASLGVPGEFSHPKMRAAMERVSTIVKARRPLAGFHVVEPLPEECIKKMAEGYDFIAYSLDSLILGSTYKRDLQRIRQK